MIKTGAISLQSPLLEVDPPALYSSIQECYLQEAENSLLSGSFWVHVKQLITALVTFRAPVRWWSIQSLLHPFIHPCNNTCRSQESVTIFIFQPRKWGIGVLRCKCRQPKGDSSVFPLNSLGTQCEAALVRVQALHAQAVFAAGVSGAEPNLHGHLYCFFFLSLI